MRAAQGLAPLAQGELDPARGRGCARFDLPLIVLQDQLIDKLVSKVRVFHDPLPFLLNLLVNRSPSV